MPSVQIDIEGATGRLSIRGPEEKLDAAEAAIEAAVGKHAVKREGSVCLKVPVVKGYVSAVIGKKGSNIQRLQDEYDVMVNVDRRDEGVTVMGLKDNCEKVRAGAERASRSKRCATLDSRLLKPCPGRVAWPCPAALDSRLLTPCFGRVA